MMNLTSPARAVIPSLDADVLMALAGVTLPMTGRQIARLIGANNHSGVGTVLQRLTVQGVVSATAAGNAFLYILNRNHVSFPAIKALTDLRGVLFERISTLVSEWKVPPLCVAVFGSAARGDGNVNSDIDILIVRDGQSHRLNPKSHINLKTQNSNLTTDIWDSQLLELSQLTYLWSGNKASLIQTTKSQLAAMFARGEQITASLHDEAQLIWGADVITEIEEEYERSKATTK